MGTGSHGHCLLGDDFTLASASANVDDEKLWKKEPRKTWYVAGPAPAVLSQIFATLRSIKE